MKQVAPMLLFATLSVHAQKSPQDMNRFIDNLMKKMTLEEKIGQLNLPLPVKSLRDRQRAAISQPV